jgi:hypothetical protein
VCGISWQENPNDSQLQIFEITALQKGAILLQALPDACVQPPDALPHALPDACVQPPARTMSMRFMRPCHRSHTHTHTPTCTPTHTHIDYALHEALP